MMELLVNEKVIFEGSVEECWGKLDEIFGEENTNKFENSCISEYSNVFGKIHGVEIQIIEK